MGYRTGYVVALKRCFSSSDRNNGVVVTWGTGSALTTQVTDQLVTEGAFSYLKADRDGLTHCRYAKANYTNYATECNVMVKAENFVSVAPLPTGRTSGWYVPSTGQLYDWLLTFSQTCGGSGSDGLITESTSWAETFDRNYPTSYFNNFAYRSTGLVSRMNGWLTGKSIPSSYYDSWNNGQYHWASTEIKPNIAYTMDFHGSLNPSSTDFTSITWQGTTSWLKSYYDRFLRCVLAF